MDSDDEVAGERDDPERVPGPHEIRRRHRRRRIATAGEVYLRTLSVEEGRWLWAMVRRTAAAHNVDRDDLFQELRLAILRSDALDHGRAGLRAWLTRLAEWRAGDLLRRDLRHARRACPLDDGVTDLPAPEPVGPDLGWSVPTSWRLNRHEAAVVQLVCWGLDLDMREFARLVSRSHAAVRQDRSRGLRKVENLFDLTPEQRTALVAHRRHDDPAAAARELELPLEQLMDLVRSAEAAIARALGHTTGPTPRDAEEEDTRDVRR